MKIGGEILDARPASEEIFFKRKDRIIGIRASAVMDRAEFDRLAPVPKPRKMRVKGNKLVDNPDDPRYLLELNQHSGLFINWLIINSLCGIDAKTKEDAVIEWDKVDKNKSTTWHLWEEDMKDAGFSDMERKRIHGLVLNVNCLTEQRLDEARNSFLHEQEEESETSSSLVSEQNGTLSGDPVNDSESDLQESQLAGTTSTQ